MGLNKLSAMSNKYGSNADYVLAGGGNTSYKDDNYLYVKGSGTSLSTIKPEDFVVMERAGIYDMMNKEYPADDKQRESMALENLMAARHLTQLSRRPSVETPLHNLFEYKFVLHVHPALVNGLTCGKKGEALCKELFGDEAVWVGITRPGYVLASICKDALDAYKAKYGKCANLLFLQNHGIFMAADTTEEIDAMAQKVMAKLEAQLTRKPDFSACEFDADKAAAISPAIRALFDGEKPSTVLFEANKEVCGYLASKQAYAPLEKPFSPDHIVYCKAFWLFVPACDDIEEQYNVLKEKYDEFVAKNGYKPKVVALEKLGLFVCGASVKEANIVKSVALDAVKIAVYSESFGGALPMTDDLIDFIVNWETESYRQKISLAAGAAKRLEGKVSVVTGSAQGFGKGIATAMAEQGAYLVIADLNIDGAQACADELNEKYGAGTAIAVKANVSDEESVEAMMRETVLAFGGCDVFVSNAGIAKAGSLEEMTKSTFELVTAINYTGYFLCTKYASRVMKIQNRFAPKYMMDIITINSKSGLTGSNKNFAYSGSKFGGIGLTQSFAMELVPFNIKVNAVCPGNLLDGPLWSDPEKGLFVQYLNAGKVPGAKTVDDVRRFYESKVPMNRGCREPDVARAIMYIIEQEYETGQAIPVTGGQEMLK